MPMTGQEEWDIRQRLHQAFSEGQVDLLRMLRHELSDRRWQVMLEVDAAQEVTAQLLHSEQDAARRQALETIRDTLDRVHRALARIPEDLIPAF
jgi:hypothetical protein